MVCQLIVTTVQLQMGLLLSSAPQTEGVVVALGSDEVSLPDRVELATLQGSDLDVVLSWPDSRHMEWTAAFTRGTENGVTIL